MADFNFRSLAASATLGSAFTSRCSASYRSCNWSTNRVSSESKLVVLNKPICRLLSRKNVRILGGHALRSTSGRASPLPSVDARQLIFANLIARGDDSVAEEIE